MPERPLGRVPGRPPAAVGHGARQRRARPATGRDADARGRRRWPRSAWRATRTTGPRRCRAARPSGPPWPGPWCATRELLLLDEPFGALDALTRIRMHALVQELCARHRPAVLLVTHDVDEAILLADRVLVLTDGVISLDVRRRRPQPPPARPTPRSSPCARACSPSSASTRSPRAPTATRTCSPNPVPTTRSSHDPHRATAPAAPPSVDLDVAPLSGTIGAEIRGLDLRALDDATVAAIRQVWLDRKVVFFPGQHLDPDEHLAFAAPLRRADRGPPGDPGHRGPPRGLRDRLHRGPRALRQLRRRRARGPGASTGTPTSPS